MGNIITKDRENFLKPLINDLKQKEFELEFLKVLKELKEQGISIERKIGYTELDINNLKSQIKIKNKEMDEITALNSIEQQDFLQQ
jgi:hypothetical protein